MVLMLMSNYCHWMDHLNSNNYKFELLALNQVQLAMVGPTRGLSELNRSTIVGHLDV